jgi:hypothetical protein
VVVLPARDVLPEIASTSQWVADVFDGVGLKKDLGLQSLEFASALLVRQDHTSRTD